MDQSISIPVDDRTREEKEKDEEMEKVRLQSGMGYIQKNKAPMDTRVTMDHGTTNAEIMINLDFHNTILLGLQDPVQRDRFDIERIFDAVSSGDVTKLEGLEEYLNDTSKTLLQEQFRPSGKTALMKALLNLNNGTNDTVEHLLGIAERKGYCKELVNATYAGDTDYEGQTALHIAIERRSDHYAKLLLEKGADVHAIACGKFFQPHEQTSFYFGELPLSLAACTNQKDMVDLLLDYNADVRCTDSLGNTVLHALVMVTDNSHENTDFIISMYDYILTKDAVKNPKQKKMEDIKNNQGFTPIKLAAKLGKIGLFEHIIQREFQQEECRHLSRKFTEFIYGPVYASLYDLDSLDTYEKNSVLEMIVYGTDIPNRLKMIQIEPLNELLRDKWNKFAYRIFMIKCIAYFLYVIIFSAVCYNHREGKSLLLFTNSTENVLELITVIGSLYFLVTGLLNVIRQRPTVQTLLVDGYSDLLFVLQAVLVLVCVGLYAGGKQVYVAFLAVSLALSWVNLLYFFRGSKQLGIYSVMIQRMVLGDLLRFVFVYIVFLVGFSAAVVTLSTSSTPDEVQKNQTDVFSNITVTTLELFKLTIGIGELEFTDQYHYKHAFYVLLISYIVLTYILLLNMLIALMSKSVEKMSEQSINIWNLQRAITILDIEKNLCCLRGKLRSGVRKKLERVGNKEENCRWCIRVDELHWKQWNQNLTGISKKPWVLSDMPYGQTEKLQEEDENSPLMTSQV